MSQLIISVAPNGARKTKKDHPNIPIAPLELAKEAKACAEAGAALFHLHVRNEEDGHSLDVGRYQAALDAIKNEIGDNLILQVTTESCNIYTPSEQIAMVKALKPEAISVAIRELIPDSSYLQQGKEFLAWVYEQKIIPQFILYSPEEIQYFSELREQGVIPAGNKYFLFVLGKKHGPDVQSSYATPNDVAVYVEAKEGYLQPEDSWGICAFGAYENACMMEALRLGGHARIGFENNLVLENGSQAENNAALVVQLQNSLANSMTVKRQASHANDARQWLQRYL